MSDTGQPTAVTTEAPPAESLAAQPMPGQEAPPVNAPETEQPATPAPAEKVTVDLGKIYADARRKFTEKTANEYNEKLVSIFGTSDFEQIKDQWAGKAPPEITQLQGTIQEKMSEIERAKAENEAIKLRSQMLLSIPQTARDKEVLIQMSENAYDFKPLDGELKAFMKGSDMPYLNNETGKQFNFSDVMDQWQKSADKGFMFQQGGGIQAPQAAAGTESGKPGNWQIPTPEQRINQTFMKAVKRSGQWNTLMSGKPIDMTAVDNS